MRAATKEGTPSKTAAGDAIADAYDVVRALLAARVCDRADVNQVARQIIRSCEDAGRHDLLSKVADEAEYHGLVPLLEPIISALAKDAAAGVPDDVRLAFVALASRHRRAAIAREKYLDELLAALEAANIPAICLKGTALAHLIYSAPQLRPMVDIDLLIKPADLARAVTAVRTLGYSFASGHGSRFAGRMHHLPPATMTKSGFAITLEIHLDALSLDGPDSLTFATLSEKPRRFQRGQGRPGLAFGHTDMLRHLARHAFEPVHRVRLKHLYDLQQYRSKFGNEIDWQSIEKKFPQVNIALQLVSCVLGTPPSAGGAIWKVKIPARAGLGMVPLSDIAKMPLLAQLGALFDPSPWWLHGYYGVPVEKSLLFCRTIQHPLRLARWFKRRLAAAFLCFAGVQPEIAMTSYCLAEGK